MKLTKILNNFYQKHFAINEEQYQQDCKILRLYTPLMFPLPSENDEIIANIELGDKFLSAGSNNRFYPFNTRNDQGLAKELASLVKFMSKMESKHESSNENWERFPDVKINFRNVLNFVKNDEFFNQTRNEYEEDLVRAQINFMMQDQQPSGLLLRTAYNNINNQFFTVKEYHFHEVMKDPNADVVFRQKVFNAMTKLGIDTHSIEAGLEKHANLWREKMMLNAYYNQYPLPAEKEKNHDLNDGINEIANVFREGFKKTWLRHRRGKYYQEHQQILDELSITNLKVSDEEMQKLKQDLYWWDGYYQSLTNIQSNKDNLSDNTKGL